MEALLVLFLIVALPVLFIKILKSLFAFVISAIRLYFYLLILLILFLLLMGRFK
jgi:hypothetical protein